MEAKENKRFHRGILKTGVPHKEICVYEVYTGNCYVQGQRKEQSSAASLSIGGPLFVWKQNTKLQDSYVLLRTTSTSHIHNGKLSRT